MFFVAVLHRLTIVGEYASSWLKAGMLFWIDPFKSILPWGSREPFVGNRSYNWQCCPISSTRSFYTSSKSTAKFFGGNCWCIFNISSPWWFWKEVWSWHHSGNGKGQHLRKVPLVPSARNAKNISTMNFNLPLQQRRGKNGALLMKGNWPVMK